MISSFQSMKSINMYYKSTVNFYTNPYFYKYIELKKWNLDGNL